MYSDDSARHTNIAIYAPVLCRSNSGRQSSHGPTQDGLLAILLESIHSRIRRNNGEDMTTGIANSKTTDEAQIRALIDDRAKAVRDKNVNEAISSIAPGILSFDVVNPFQQMGSDASKKRAEDWF
jgi:hypothetical protein